VSNLQENIWTKMQAEDPCQNSSWKYQILQLDSNMCNWFDWSFV